MSRCVVCVLVLCPVTPLPTVPLPVTPLTLPLPADAPSAMENQTTFLYFAYGSNLLKERLQLKNPSARVHCIARGWRVTAGKGAWPRSSTARGTRCGGWCGK
uniref:Gamma-glutamylcyclotransferase n=1 Tax=Astyanax mexicanus TaxID=7994 RepID=A0A8B9GT24_ASTMX